MLTDLLENRTGEHPLVAGLGGIVVVDGAAGVVHAVHGVLNVRQPALPVPRLQASGDGAGIFTSGHLLPAAHLHPAALFGPCRRAGDAARVRPSYIFYLYPLSDHILPQASAGQCVIEPSNTAKRSPAGKLPAGLRFLCS